MQFKLEYSSENAMYESSQNPLQWNLSVTTTSLIKLDNCDLFSNVF